MPRIQGLILGENKSFIEIASGVLIILSLKLNFIKSPRNDRQFKFRRLFQEY